MGTDLVPSFLIKDCRLILQPLLHIFNLVLKHKVYPDCWKIARVTPVFKNGNRNEIGNYRPISIISNVSKVFEVMLFKRMYHHVSNYLATDQHGFIKGKSTATNLCSFVHYVSGCLDVREQVDSVYTDFSKAFDQVQHPLILNKLNNFGIANNIIELIQSYLTDRRNYVEYRGVRSFDYASVSGVPQGSVLGSLLFLMFINDIVDGISSKCLLYADDLKIFRCIRSKEDCEMLQGDLDSICDWCVKNQLHLNINKCKVLVYCRRISSTAYRYSISNVELPHCETVEDLGITFATGMTFSGHMVRVKNEAFNLLGFLARNTRDFRGNDALICFFNAFIRSKLEYCSIVWSPCYKKYTDLIESVQRKFLKTLFYRKHGRYLDHGYCYDLLLSEFGYMSLQSRRTISGLTFLHKLVNGVVMDSALLELLCFCVPQAGTRSRPTFYVPSVNTHHFFSSPVLSMCRSANDFCSDIDLFNISRVGLSTLLRRRME